MPLLEDGADKDDLIVVLSSTRHSSTWIDKASLPPDCSSNNIFANRLTYVPDFMPSNGVPLYNVRLLCNWPWLTDVIVLRRLRPARRAKRITSMESYDWQKVAVLQLFNKDICTSDLELPTIVTTRIHYELRKITMFTAALLAMVG